MDLEDVRLTHQCTVHYDYNIQKWLTNHVPITEKKSTPSIESLSDISFDILSDEELKSEIDVKIQRNNNSNLIQSRVRPQAYFSTIGVEHYTNTSIDDWLIKPTERSTSSELLEFVCCKAKDKSSTPCNSFLECDCMLKNKEEISNCANRLVSMHDPAWNSWLIKQDIPLPVKNFVKRNELHENNHNYRKINTDLPEDLKCWLSTYSNPTSISVDSNLDTKEQGEISISNQEPSIELSDHMEIEQDTSKESWREWLSKDSSLVIESISTKGSNYVKYLSEEISCWLWPKQSLEHKISSTGKHWNSGHHYTDWLDRSSNNPRNIYSTFYDHSKWLVKS